MWLLDLIGSLGLFLLGMWLMTEGLKLAGGRALQNLLGRWTSTRLRGLAAGLLVTALVQSSSAITVAAIGFVNAGLLTFQQSVWVIFGSNVGTTMTAWLVTLFGFSVDIDAFTFPLFGVGAFLRVFSPAKRGQALGMALAGFGLLFMGIDALQSTFTGLESQLDVAALNRPGFLSILLGVGLGFFLTLVTQSSSAAIALILTAVASGVAGLNLAAAAVIGANIGTTSTAMLASIGATPNARRLALAHVAFNLITAMVAVLLLPLFTGMAGAVADTRSSAGLTFLLALFHTAFNLLGVLLMWPLEPVLSRRLLRLFEKPAGVSKESNLDKNVATVPDLAVRALTLELLELRERISNISLEQLLQPEPAVAVENEMTSAAQLAELESRLDGVNQFVQLISQADLSPLLSTRVTAGFSVNHYLGNALDTLKAIAGQAQQAPSSMSLSGSLLREWLAKAAAFARDTVHSDRTYHDSHWQELQSAYAQLKNAVLAAGVHRQADITSVEVTLFIASLSKRYIDQLLQVANPLEKLMQPQDQAEIAPAVAPVPLAAVAATPDGNADGS